MPSISLMVTWLYVLEHYIYIIIVYPLHHQHTYNVYLHIVLYCLEDILIITHAKRLFLVSICKVLLHDVALQFQKCTPGDKSNVLNSPCVCVCVCVCTFRFSINNILIIYEYHRISLNDSQELANSAYILTPVTSKSLLIQCNYIPCTMYHIYSCYHLPF